MNTGRDASDVFAYLIFGLKSYFDKNCYTIPTVLRHAMNHLSFAKGEKFPKTMRQFLGLCHQPLQGWYPNDISDFNSRQALLYENELSEEAQDYYLDLLEEWETSPDGADYQDLLDNAKMKSLRKKLLAMPEKAKAQTIYVDVRSFLIEHSWAQLDELRDAYEIFEYLGDFFQEMPLLPLKALKVCPHCGILTWQNQQWQGIKPSYCNEHGPNAPLLSIPNQSQLYRLKSIIHKRVFLPGQLEKDLFNLAENLEDEVYLLKTERYPGIDSYDLRLSFSDGDIWAIDAKDHANPRRLGREIKPPFSEGDLAYSHAFYVIPDRRMDEPEYRESLEHDRQFHAPNLFVLSFSEFKERLETKLEDLAKVRRNAKKD